MGPIVLTEYNTTGVGNLMGRWKTAAVAAGGGGPLFRPCPSAVDFYRDGHDKIKIAFSTPAVGRVNLWCAHALERRPMCVYIPGYIGTRYNRGIYTGNTKLYGLYIQYTFNFYEPTVKFKYATYTACQMSFRKIVYTCVTFIN